MQDACIDIIFFNLQIHTYEQYHTKPTKQYLWAILQNTQLQFGPTPPGKNRDKKNLIFKKKKKSLETCTHLSMSLPLNVGSYSIYAAK